MNQFQSTAFPELFMGDPRALYGLFGRKPRERKKMIPLIRHSIKLSCLVAIILLLLSESVMGSPPQVIQRLIDEPVTIFDLGMFRLNQQVIEFTSIINKSMELPGPLNKNNFGEEVSFLGTAYYDANNGRFVITYTLMQTTPVPNMAKIEDFFRKIFDLIRLWYSRPEVFGSAFSHYTDALEKKEELAKELIKRVEIVITQSSQLLPTSSTLSQGPIKVEKIVRCQGALVSDQISCSIEKAH
jgi:hypothetical protein